MEKMKFLLVIVQLCFMTTNFAATPAWKIVPAKSSLVFVATQNGAPVKGRFKKFSGIINFDLDRLNDSKIKITVDMNSVETSHEELTTTLATADWFDVKLFPDAVFESTKFIKDGGNRYHADGRLTIRDQSAPVTVSFTADQPTKNSAMVKGSTILKRTAFDVGQGEWASLDEVGDEVKVDFVVSAVR